MESLSGNDSGSREILNCGVKALGLTANSPDQAPGGQVSENRGGKQGAEPDRTAKIIGVGTRQGKWISIGLHHARSGGARPTILCRHQRSNRGTPPSIRIGEEFHLAPNPLFDLGLAGADFLFGLGVGQFGEGGVGDAMCPETKPVLRQRRDLMPVEQGLWSTQSAWPGQAFVLPQKPVVMKIVAGNFRRRNTGAAAE